MAILIETRGPKQGICNICGVDGPLSEDHTPPQGCIKVTQVELHHIMQILSVELPKSKGRVSQNGVKYRTLCSHCNSGLLGTKYDPIFIEFVNELGDYLKSKIHLPLTIKIKTKPQKLMRSLLGHMAAQGVNRYQKGNITEQFRDYILDETCDLPDSLNVYFWPYPYKRHVMARDCTLLDTMIDEPVSIWFIKFFPVAFMVTIDEPKGYEFNEIGCLSSYRSIKIDEEIDVSINLKKIIHPHWPELPISNNLFLIYGQEAITSFVSNRRKR